MKKVRATQDQSRVLFVRCGFLLHRAVKSVSKRNDTSVNDFALQAIREKLERMGIDVKAISNTDASVETGQPRSAGGSVSGIDGTSTRTGEKIVGTNFPWERKSKSD